MLLQESGIFQPSIADQLEKRKFTRRNDLTTAIRLLIANTALYAQMTGAWGTITDLANAHDISRTFVYSLGSRLNATVRFWRNGRVHLFLVYSGTVYSDDVITSTGGAKQYCRDLDDHETIWAELLLGGVH